MKLSQFLLPESVSIGIKGNSKKQVLQEIAALAAQVSRLPERMIFEGLLQRERLGSTGIGNGIAIPHSKMAGLDRLIGVFARFSKPIDYDAVDDQPVDLAFVILAPEQAGADHLQALARVARVLRSETIAQKLRQAETADVLHAILTREESSRAA
jgi:nitrogen PTS system EIIA component